MIARRGFSREFQLKLVEAKPKATALTDAPVVSPEIAKVSETLATFSTDAAALGSGQWMQIGAAVWWATGGSDEGFAAFENWSRAWVYYSADETRTRWENCAASPPAEMDADTLFRMAEKAREQERALEEATRLDDVAYQTQKRALKEKAGLPLGALDAERKRRRKRGPAPAPKPAPPSIEELAKAAGDLIAAEDVLGLFVKDISHRLAGADGGSAELLYLSMTSRLFQKPMNAALKGESSAGKSYEIECVLAYLPPEDIERMTTMTPQAMNYLPESLSHKILYMAEAAGTDEHSIQDYVIREIISSGAIRRYVAVAGGSGELPTTQVVVTEGPIMFVTTSTRARLHPEMETRILTVEANDTASHTRRVVEKVAEVEGGLVEANKADPKWAAFQRWLAAGERQVTIPFASALARHRDLYVKGVRMRRDFRQVLTAVAAHALIHREHRQRDDQGRIVATIADYKVAYALLESRLAQGAGVALREKDKDVFEAVQELQIELSKDEGVKVTDLIDHLRSSQATVNRRLTKLLMAGFVENLNPGRGKTGRYRVVGEPRERFVLPDPDDLLEAWRPNTAD